MSSTGLSLYVAVVIKMKDFEDKKIVLNFVKLLLHQYSNRLVLSRHTMVYD